VHDSQDTDSLLDEKDTGECFYADLAYTGEPQGKIIENKRMENQVCEKGYMFKGNSVYVIKKCYLCARFKTKV
jgi:hypothetical protein